MFGIGGAIESFNYYENEVKQGLHKVNNTDGVFKKVFVQQVVTPRPAGKSAVVSSTSTINNTRSRSSSSGSWTIYWKRTKFSWFIVAGFIILCFLIFRFYTEHVRQLRLEGYTNQIQELEERVYNLKQYIIKSELLKRMRLSKSISN